MPDIYFIEMPIHRLGQILVFCILTDGKRKNNIPHKNVYGDRV